VNSALTCGHASALQRVCSITRRTRLMRSQGCQRRASVPLLHARATIRAMRTIALLTASNVFMTAAWYGHLRFRHAALWKATFSDFAVLSIASSTGTCEGSSALTRTATRAARGIASLSNSSRFDMSSRTKKVDPVTFPPGRARLATRPDATASPLVVMTIGIVVVACLAARTLAVPPVRMRSTLRRTSSDARAGSRS
jgi:hypothetical protein